MIEAKAQAEQLTALNAELSKGRQDFAGLETEWNVRVQAWEDQLKDLSHQVEEQTEEMIAAHQSVKLAKETALKAIEAAEVERDEAIEQKKQAIRDKEMAFDECVQFVKERNEASRRAAQESVFVARKDRDIVVRSVQQEKDDEIRRAHHETELALREKEKEIEEIAHMIQVRDAAARKAARQAILAAESERDQVLEEKEKTLSSYEQKLKDSEAAARQAAREAILAAEAERDRALLEKDAIRAVEAEREQEMQRIKAEKDRVMDEKKEAITACERKMKESMRTAQLERDRVMREAQAALDQMEKMVQERDAAMKQLKESRSEVNRLSATISAVPLKDTTDVTQRSPLLQGTTSECEAAEARDAGEDSASK